MPQDLRNWHCLTEHASTNAAKSETKAVRMLPTLQTLSAFHDTYAKAKIPNFGTFKADTKRS